MSTDNNTYVNHDPIENPYDWDLHESTSNNNPPVYSKGANVKPFKDLSYIERRNVAEEYAERIIGNTSGSIDPDVMLSEVDDMVEEVYDAKQAIQENAEMRYELTRYRSFVRILKETVGLRDYSEDYVVLLVCEDLYKTKRDYIEETRASNED